MTLTVWLAHQEQTQSEDRFTRAAHCYEAAEPHKPDTWDTKEPVPGVTARQLAPKRLRWPAMARRRLAVLHQV